MLSKKSSSPFAVAIAKWNAKHNPNARKNFISSSSDLLHAQI